MNTHDPAPGANDDLKRDGVAGGGAIVRRLKFPQRWCLFVSPGEEQGLTGSRHLAKLRRSKAGSWKVC